MLSVVLEVELVLVVVLVLGVEPAQESVHNVLPFRLLYWEKGMVEPFVALDLLLVQDDVLGVVPPV